MKFSVMHADFAASLDKLSAVVPAKPNLQVLSCVHLRLTEKTLVILTNNLSLAVKVEIPARNDEPGEIAVNFKTLIEWVKSFKPNSRIDAEVLPGEPEQYKEEPCSDCKGTGKLPCAVCNGTQKKRASFSANSIELPCDHCTDGTRECSCTKAGHSGVKRTTTKIAVPDKLALSCGSRRLTIPLHDRADQFPALPDVEENPYKFLFIAYADQLHDLIEQTLPAVATEDNRPILTGALWVVRPVGERKETDPLTERGTDKLTLDIAATDGYRLHLARLPLVESEQFNAIVPGDTMKYLMKQTAKKVKGDEEKPTVWVYQNKTGGMMFSLGSVGVYSISVDGRFPDYERVIPNVTPVQVQVNPEELAANIKSVSGYAKESANTVNMRMEPSKNDHLLTVRAVSPRGDSEVDQKAILHAPDTAPIRFCFNYQFVLDALGAIKDGGCFLLSDQHRIPHEGEAGLMGPTIIKGVRDPHFLAVLMPMSRN